jgi:transposase InsO family protein
MPARHWKHPAQSPAAKDAGEEHQAGEQDSVRGVRATFAYVSTWQGWRYLAFVVDVFARCIVGWRVSSSMRTNFALDAFGAGAVRQAAKARRGAGVSLRSRIACSNQLASSRRRG